MIEKLFIYDIKKANAQRLANLVKEKYSNMEVVVVESPEQAARESDIIDCVTLASEPFIKGEWLKKDALVMNMADYEVDNDCVKRADKLVVDFWEGIKHRMISTVALAVECNRRAFMSEYFRQRFYIHSALYRSCGKRMTKRVKTTPRDIQFSLQ